MVKLALAVAFLAVFGLGGLYLVVRIIDRVFDKKKTKQDDSKEKVESEKETQTTN